ncbi:NucA/NucB deoxyribonuclease domain-containing protein [Streptomyces luteireticuli]|uniref:NucA/NucB deoxyribonuclease domain-containing protein n=1 Tax=Streptomyces luteireticuli TaxID=173858 RepID=UPI003556D61A
MKVNSIVAAGASALALTASVLAGTAQAKSSEATISVTQVQAPLRAGGAALTAGCNWYSRTDLCQEMNITVTLLVNKKPVGTAKFTAKHEMQLQVKNRKWKETIGISKAQLTPQARGIRMGLNVSCGGSCSADNHLKSHTLGSAKTGSVDYTDNVKAFKIHNTANRFTYTFTKPGFTPATVTYTTLAYRCDDMFAKKPGKTKPRQAPGCVIPKFTPTLTDMASLPNISQGIRTIQARGGHYGKPGSGHPLHMLDDKKKEDANRKAVCGGKSAPPGSAGPSCDEYPFASTREGGTALPAASRGITWVPLSENRKQGGMLNSFELKQRVLDGDAYWVSV